MLKLAEVLEALTRNVTKEDNSDRYPNKGEHVHHKLHEDLQKKNEDESGHCGSNRTKSISSAVNSKLRNKRVHSEIEDEDAYDDEDGYEDEHANYTWLCVMIINGHGITVQ